jgi:acyl-CoA reductase-like NAD-dependent aldehyde dehydrogenase
LADTLASVGGSLAQGPVRNLTLAECSGRRGIGNTITAEAVGMAFAASDNGGAGLDALTYEHEAEAVAIANDTPYGLQAYLISSNPDRASAVASIENRIAPSSAASCNA